MGMTEALLRTHLKRLQLPYFAEHHTALMAQAGRESWSHGRVLEQLVEGEVARRDAALIERRVKAAHLPGIKTLDGFDWSWPKKINRAQLQQVFRLDFLPQHGNVILLGGVGVGKTHLAIALAHTACLKGRTTLFTSAVDIVMRWPPPRRPAASSARWRACSSRRCLSSTSSAICRSTSSAPMRCSR